LGWIAIEAYAPDAPREVRCILRWRKATREFADPCGGSVYPADGTGLRTYPGTVTANGVVEIDLHSR